MSSRSLGLPSGSYSMYLDRRISNMTAPALLPGQQGPLLEASLQREDKKACMPSPGPGGQYLQGSEERMLLQDRWYRCAGKSSASLGERCGKEEVAEACGTVGQASGARFPCSDIFCRWLWRIFRLFSQAWRSRLSWRHSAVEGWHTFYLTISLISAEIET